MDGLMAMASDLGRSSLKRTVRRGLFRSGRPCRIFRFSVKWGTCPVDDRNWIISSLGLGACLCARAEQIGRHRESSSGMDAGGRNRGVTRRLRKGVLGLMRKGRREVQFWSVVFLIGTLGPACARPDPETGPGPRGPGRYHGRGAVGCSSNRQREAAQAASRRSGAEVTLASTDGTGLRSHRLAPRRGSRREPSRPRRGGDGVWQLGPRRPVACGPGSKCSPGGGAHRPPRGRHGPDPDRRRAGTLAANSSPVSAGRERGTPAVGFLESRPRAGCGVGSGRPGQRRAGLAQVQHPLARRRRGDCSHDGRAPADERWSEPIWRDERREVVPANKLDPPERIWPVPAPRDEGTYVLELNATWEPAAARESSRLGRLIRRRKPAPVVNSATRRMVLAVVAPRDPGPRPRAGTKPTAARSRSTRSTWGESGARGSRPGGVLRSRRRAGRSGTCPRRFCSTPGAKERDRDRLRNWISADGGRGRQPGAGRRLGTGLVGRRSARHPSGPAASPGRDGHRRRSFGPRRGDRRSRRQRTACPGLARRLRVGPADPEGRPARHASPGWSGPIARDPLLVHSTAIPRARSGWEPSSSSSWSRCPPHRSSRAAEHSGHPDAGPVPDRCPCP